MEISAGKSDDLMFGLTTSKDAAFYRALDEAEEGKDAGLSIVGDPGVLLRSLLS